MALASPFFAQKAAAASCRAGADNSLNRACKAFRLCSFHSNGLHWGRLSKRAWDPQ